MLKFLGFVPRLKIGEVLLIEFLICKEFVMKNHVVFPLQESLAKRVVAGLRSHKYVALCSPMQSGKTGMIREIAKLWGGTKKGFFMTAVADLLLRDQNREAFENTNVRVLEKFEIRKETQSRTLSYLGEKIPKRALVIIDEAHFGVGDTDMISAIFNFLVSEHECYLVGVSATNWMLQLSNMGLSCKRVSPTVKELSDAGYIGVESLIDRVIDLGDECSPVENIRMLFPLLSDYLKNGKGKYIIIRDTAGKFSKYQPTHYNSY